MTDPVWAARRTSFGSQAEAYARGRPAYPLETIRWVLPAGARTALDLGAGTGRISARLLELGLEVTAVEPIDEMRAFVPPPVVALRGTAEAIPLPDASVDAVLVGQAFHWFDVPRAMPEVGRVLRPGGRLGLCWNLLDDGDPWTRRLADLLQAEERAGGTQSNDPPPPYSGVEGFSDPVRRVDRHVQAYDVDALLAFVMSRSMTILLDPEVRAELLEQVRAIAPAGRFPVAFVCESWRGDRLPD